MDDDIVIVSNRPTSYPAVDATGQPIYETDANGVRHPKRIPISEFELDASGRVVYETDVNGIRHPKRRRTGEFELDAEGRPIPELDPYGNPVLADGLPVFRKRTHTGAFELDANGFIRMELDANGERHPKRIHKLVDVLDGVGLPVMDLTDPAHPRRKQKHADDCELDEMPIVGTRNFVQLAGFLQHFDQVVLSEPMKVLETRWIELRMAGEHGRLHESEDRFVKVVNALDEALACIDWLAEY